MFSTEVTVASVLSSPPRPRGLPATRCGNVLLGSFRHQILREVDFIRFRTATSRSQPLRSKKCTPSRHQSGWWSQSWKVLDNSILVGNLRAPPTMDTYGFSPSSARRLNTSDLFLHQESRRGLSHVCNDPDSDACARCAAPNGIIYVCVAQSAARLLRKCGIVFSSSA